MTKFVYCVAAVLAAFCIFMCADIVRILTSKNTKPQSEEYAINSGTLTDTKTGCQYIVTDRGHITPRMHADGTQVCLKVF